MRRIQSWSGICAFALLAACSGTIPEGADEQTVSSPLVSADGKLVATLTISSQWGGGYCSSVRVVNNGTSSTSTWTVAVNLNGDTVTSSWNATLTTSAGVLTAKPLSWNAAIAPRGAADFGFCANSSSTPHATLQSVSGSSTTGGSSGSSGSTGASGSSGSSTTGGSTGSSGSSGAGGSSGTGGSSGAGGSTDAGTSTDAGGSRDSGAATDAGTPTGGGLKKFVGNITTNGQVRSDFATYWDQITPENEGKWGSVEGTRNVMNWSGLDRAYAYAKARGIPFKQHTFVWGAQQPGWIGSLSAAEQRAEVEEWIKLFCQRYPDTALIDVVNEPPPHTTPVYMNALGGAGASGYDWIVQSFKWAHQYCPKAVLILNDYNTIEYPNDNTRFIDIVNRIKAAGAPIHGIGAQAHDAYKLPTSTVQGYIKKLQATGLPVYITEYDINLADDTQQKNVMQSQFTMFWTDPNIKGVTLWGYVVGSTWVANSGLMTSTGQKRPAMTWLMNYLGR